MAQSDHTTNLKTVTCVAPVNIATIKYWGKRDEELILPFNDSISVTLSVDLMQAKTSVCASPNFKQDRMWLNGREEVVSENKRLLSCISEIKERARVAGDGQSDGVYDWHIHICSENNFPTAAGLASSAAGYACLVYALAKLYNLKGDLTSIARRGSGSACRSLHGGFVRWLKGVLPDGTDSIATQVAPASHWPQLRILILIVREEKKSTSSTSGMKQSVLTSDLFPRRTQDCVPARITDMTKAIMARDFPRFAEVTMRDSNQFHAICLDTYPPAVYMTDVSHSIAALVHAFNASCGEVRLAYSYDAGANACLFMLDQHAPLVVSLLDHFFPQSSDNFRGERVGKVDLPSDLVTDIGIKPHAPGLIKGMIFSEVGDGPKVLSEEKRLVGDDGLPLSI